MRIPARAAGPLVAMAIAAASFGCIAPAAYAENATAAVISDDGSHVVVDVDLNGSAPVGDATEQADMKSSQGESVSDAEPDEALKAFEPLTAVDSIKMYGSGNAQKLVKETTSIVDQVASGLKDSTGIDLPSLLNGLISNPDIDAGSAENSVE